MGQTKGGTLNTIIQPEPPILVTALNQQQPTLTLGGKICESLLALRLPISSRCLVSPSPGPFHRDGLVYTFKLFPASPSMTASR